MKIQSKLQAVLLGLIVSLTANAASVTDIEALLTNPSRTAGDADRDEGRKPAAVLAFLGVEPGMTVLDVALGGVTAGASEAGVPTVPDLRAELQQLRADYEQRIAALEARIVAAEQARLTEIPAVVGSSAVSDKAFNPAISLILGGHYTRRSNADPVRDVPGFQQSDGAGSFTQGLLVGESELTLQANIDDKFYGVATLALESDAGETSISVEEAYLQTLSLPIGLSLKAGKFYSGVGYINGMHSHATGFFDDPLPYKVMFDGRLADSGLQLSWTPATLLYMQYGLELFAGDSFPAAGAARGGTGTWTAFTKFGGDLNDSNSWLAGLSYVSSVATDRGSGGTARATGTDPLFSGASNTWVGSFVWKWSPYGNPRERSFKLATEYLYRDEHGALDLNGVSARLDGHQRGYYVDAEYRLHPQWSVGLRYDALEASNRVGVAVPTPLADDAFRPRRIAAMVAFANSEFSTLRLQYARDRSTPFADNQLTLQYIMSMGAHGAHNF